MMSHHISFTEYFNQIVTVTLKDRKNQTTINKTILMVLYIERNRQQVHNVFILQIKSKLLSAIHWECVVTSSEIQGLSVRSGEKTRRKFSSSTNWRPPGYQLTPRLRVVPHFSTGIVKRAKLERAWKSPHARKASRRVSPFLAWGDFHARSRFARSTVPDDKWGTTRSLTHTGPLHHWAVVWFKLSGKLSS